MNTTKTTLRPNAPPASERRQVLRISRDLLIEAQAAANACRVSLNDWFLRAIESELNRKQKPERVKRR